MLNKFKELFYSNNLNIQFPLENETEDWNIKNELLLRGIVPKTLEPQCLLGVPLKNKDINEKVLQGTINVYEEYLKPKVLETINKYKNLKLNGDIV